MKYFSKIASVQPAGSGDVFHGNIILEILFDIGYRFLHIKIPEAVALAVGDRGGRTDKAVDEEVEMPDQVEGRFFLMVDNIEHFRFHRFGNVLITCFVDRLVAADACQVDGFFCPQAVEFQPGVFPGNLMVCDISGNLMGKQHEPLPAFDLVSDGYPLAVFCE